MRLIRLYDELERGSHTLSLSASCSHHLLKVLRAPVGTEVEVFDGKGNWIRGLVSPQSTKKSAIIDIAEQGVTSNESNVFTTMYLGISKGDRFEYALQKATELGVNRVVPLVSERSEFKLQGDRLDKKLNAWRQIVTSACEQCARYHIPTVETPQRLKQAVDGDCSEEKWVLHHRANSPIDRSLSPASVSFIIGPEGGLSEDEIQTACNAGFKARLFGPRVLRTETAPIVALSLIQTYFGDF